MLLLFMSTEFALCKKLNIFAVNMSTAVVDVGSVRASCNMYAQSSDSERLRYSPIPRHVDSMANTPE
jgi:hypothetical protein